MREGEAGFLPRNTHTIRETFLQRELAGQAYRSLFTGRTSDESSLQDVSSLQKSLL